MIGAVACFFERGGNMFQAEAVKAVISIGLHVYCHTTGYHGLILIHVMLFSNDFRSKQNNVYGNVTQTSMPDSHIVLDFDIG